MTPVKLLGQISVEITATDFVDAADHQRRLEQLLGQVREAYPQATLVIRERRERKNRRGLDQPPSASTGKLNRYAP